MKFTHHLAATVVALLPLPLLAQEKKPEIEHGTLSVYMENDLFGGTDRYYTSGVKIGWSSANLNKFSESQVAAPLVPILEILPFINTEGYQRNFLLTLGQNIYTPDNTESVLPVEGDRPYAGWLYMGAGVAWKNESVRQSLVLNVGVVGSWSFAQEAQRMVHDFRKLDHPKGWDNQLHNELGVTGVYLREWRWPAHERRTGLNWEFIPHAGLVVGNVQTYANLGGELRAGLHLPDDFGTAAIGPASTTSTPVEGAAAAERSRFDLGLYVFARVDGRAVARNIFLDGNTFGNSASVDHKWAVADLSVGAAVNYGNTKFAYALIYRTEEFYGQKGGQVFGTVSFNVAL